MANAGSSTCYAHDDRLLPRMMFFAGAGGCKSIALRAACVKIRLPGSPQSVLANLLH
jgi:hypothetical protein